MISDCHCTERPLLSKYTLTTRWWQCSMCRTRECTVPVHPLHLYTLGVKSMPEIPQKLWAILIFPLHKVKSYLLGYFGKIGALIGIIISGRRTIIVPATPWVWPKIAGNHVRRATGDCRPISRMSCHRPDSNSYISWRRTQITDCLLIMGRRGAENVLDQRFSHFVAPLPIINNQSLILLYDIGKTL